MSKVKSVMKLDDKIILITGCSSGIGWYCATELNKRQGWKVFASARDPSDVKHLQDEGLTALQLDLADSHSINNAVDAMLAQTNNRIDVLFNNGAYGQPGAVEDLSRTALRHQFETNVFGTQELSNRLIPIMRKQGSGKIIQNSSVLGFVALRYRGAYNASKYALEGLSDTMRLELHQTGIHVVLIEPGPITSDFRKNATAQFHRHFSDDIIAASAHRDFYNDHLSKVDGRHTPPFTLGPDAVYKALVAALKSPHPKTRYPVTVPTSLFWWCKRLLPTKLLDSLLRRVT